MNAFPPPHTPVPSHARHGSTSSVSSISQFQQPQPFMPSPSTSTSTSVNQTRILLLSNFNPALKTKDLIQLVSDRVPTASPTDSFKLKWRDDTSCFVVFAEPFAAKRAFLRLIADPPAPLSPRETGTYAPCIHAYTGPDSAQIIQAVQNKQRSRSIAGMGAISGSAAAAAAAATGPSAGQSGGQSHGHHRTASWTRQSIDRRAAASQLAASIPTVPVADGAPSSPTRTRTTTNNSTTSEGDVSNRPGAGDSSYSWRAASPDVITSGTGASGVVAGEAPRRFGGGGGGGALGATKSD